MMEGGASASVPDDALLSRLYQQVANTQEPQYAAGYDLEAGLSRYQAWLRAHSEAAATTLTPAPAEAPDTLVTLTTLTPAPAEAPDTIVTAPAQPGEWNADLAVIELYSMHYTALVRLAAMLVRDTPTAEEVVQDSFIAMHDGWERLRDTEKALAYMRQAVVNRSRSVLRHRMVVEKNQQKPPPDMPSAEHGALALVERSAVIAALRDLPERQREAIVLRYYADLSEAEIADAMKISRGAVKSHTSRAMAALRVALEYDV
jgi:RNA polymerase sigma-70 factor (sigma-E family)